MKTPSQEKLEKLLRENPNKGPRMLTPEEVALLRQATDEAHDYARKRFEQMLAERKDKSPSPAPCQDEKV